MSKNHPTIFYTSKLKIHDKILSGLRNCVNAHGPIEPNLFSSAIKRIQRGIESTALLLTTNEMLVLKRVHDLLKTITRNENGQTICRKCKKVLSEDGIEHFNKSKSTGLPGILVVKSNEIIPYCQDCFGDQK